MDHHLEPIWKLLHLKYLSLRGHEGISHLPESLGNLKQLETLDVTGTQIIRLPQAITKLRKLQYIRAGWSLYTKHLVGELTEDVQKLIRKKLCVWTLALIFLCVGSCCLKFVKRKIDIVDNAVNRHDVCTIFCCTFFPPF